MTLPNWMSRRNRHFSPTLSRSLLVAIWVATLEAAFAAFLMDESRFVAAYTVAFAWVMTLGLGALFFVILHHLVGAHWSNSLCFQMERVSQILCVGPVLFLPLVLLDHPRQPWLHVGHWLSFFPSLSEPALALSLFCARSAVYLAVWGGLSTWFRRAPSESSGANQTGGARRLRRFSGPAMIAFGLTTNFAAFDWWMSLSPNFHSAVYGVYVFAGAVVGAISWLVVILPFVTSSNAFRSSNGPLSSDADPLRGASEMLAAEVCTASARYDLAKMLFGFVAFWGYIAFCQVLLIEYTHLPNEVAFYARRYGPAYRWLSLALVASHLLVPLVLLLPQTGKRSLSVLATASLVLLAGHYFDLAWLIQPELASHGSKFGFPELACLAFALCTLIGVMHGTPVGVVRIAHPERASDSATANQRKESASDLPPNRELLDVRWVVEPAVAFRERGWLPPGLTWLSAGIALLGLIGGVATACQFDTRLRAQASELNARASVESLDQTRIDDAQRKAEYRWVDQRQGVLRIPVERARQLFLEELRHPAEPAPVAKEGTLGP